MQKQADFFSFLSGAGKNVANFANIVAQFYLWALGGAAILGGASGYGAAKLSSPNTIAENSDKEIENEALKAEIDVTQRRINALEQRKKEMAKLQEQPKPYDRFVV